MPEQVAVIATITAKPGCVDKIHPAMEAVIEASLKEPGCITYILHTDIEDPKVFVMYEVWRDISALEAHFQTPHFNEAVKALDEITTEVHVRKMKAL